MDADAAVWFLAEAGGVEGLAGGHFVLEFADVGGAWGEFDGVAEAAVDGLDGVFGFGEGGGEFVAGCGALGEGAEALLHLDDGVVLEDDDGEAFGFGGAEVGGASAEGGAEGDDDVGVVDAVDDGGVGIVFADGFAEACGGDAEGEDAAVGGRGFAVSGGEWAVGGCSPGAF